MTLSFHTFKTMARVIIKFLAIHVEDDQVDSFLRDMEEVLKKFAGSAYNFRYDVESTLLKVTPKGSEKITSSSRR